MIKIPDSITQFLRRAKVGEDELTILADSIKGTLPFIH